MRGSTTIRPLIAALVAAGAMTVGLVAAGPASAATLPANCSNLQATMNGSSPGDTIILDAGSVCFNGDPSNSGNSYNLPSHPITLQGGGSGATFDGNGCNCPILTGSDVGNTVINNLTFQNSAANGSGAAINITGNSSPTLDTLRFFGNSTDESAGGAVYISTSPNSTGTVRVNNSTFGSSAPGTGNTTVVGSCCSDVGGGLYINTPKPVILTNSGFTGNTAEDGGGFFYDESGPPNLTVSGNSFANNRAVGDNNGGGAFASSEAGNNGIGTFTFGSNTFSGNQSDVDGGAIYIPTSCSQQNNITLSGNAFSGNQANFRGGGLALEACNGDNNHWTLNGNTFSGNRVAEQSSDSAVGGGAYLAGSHDISLTQNANVFDSNSITSATSPTSGFVAGGGEWLQGMALSSTGDRFTNNSLPKTGPGNPAIGSGIGAEAGCSGNQTTDPLTFVNGVIAGNSTPGPAEGAGLYVGGCNENVGLSLLDSTIAGNAASGGASLFGDAGDTLTANNSIIRGGVGSSDVNGFISLTASSSDACLNGGALVGSGNICADPKLVAPGPGSANVHQTAASPTIDAGSNALVPPGLTTDFEGKPRIVAGHAGGAAIVDMGADEAPAGTVPAAVTKPAVTTPLTPRVFALGTFTFSNKAVKINRKTGVGFIVVFCHESVGDVCAFSGGLYINQATTASTAAKKKAKTHRVKIGTVSGTVPGGKSGRLRVKLNKKGLALLKQKGSLTVTYIGTMRHRGPGVRHIRRHVKLKLG
jgi:predicted outer membrane repeat protein